MISVERDVKTTYKYYKLKVWRALNCILLSLPVCLFSVWRGLRLLLYILYCMCRYELLSASEQCRLLCRLEYKAATQHCSGSTKIWRRRSTEM